MSENPEDYNYIRITYQHGVSDSQPIHDTWKHKISRDRLVKLLCNYLVRSRQSPESIAFDDYHGLRIDMSQRFIWSRTSSEVIVTSGNDREFGSGFSLKEYEDIKRQVEEYWRSEEFVKVRARAKKRETREQK